MELSHNCLEGFELSRLNRISNLRKEFHQLLAEWIEFEIEARFARWVLDYRRLADFGALATQNVAPAFGAPHVSDQLILPSGNELPEQFPFASMRELRESVAVELRLPFRSFSVSQDASAALHSLEHFARCKARSIGESPVFLPDFDAPDSPAACSFLSFSRREPAHELRNVSSRLSCVLASTNQSVRYIVRFSSTFVASDYSAPVEPSALSDLTPLPEHGQRASRLTKGDDLVLRRGSSQLCRPAQIQLSLRQVSLRRAAILLRN